MLQDLDGDTDASNLRGYGDVVDSKGIDGEALMAIAEHQNEEIKAMGFDKEPFHATKLRKIISKIQEEGGVREDQIE